MLYAAEAGSRAWGFASPDSDYDIRFIYQHPVDWYLSIQKKRDVLEFPITEDLLDVSGWELRKSCRLFIASNPALYEWLVSPIIYREQGEFAGQLRSLVHRQYSRKQLAWHYLRMAEKNYSRYIEPNDRVRLKKYLYVIRPLLMLQWMDSWKTLPPISIYALLENIKLPREVKLALSNLLRVKVGAPEIAEAKRVSELDVWIQAAIISARRVCAKESEGHPSVMGIDTLFKCCVKSHMDFM